MSVFSKLNIVAIVLGVTLAVTAQTLDFTQVDKLLLRGEGQDYAESRLRLEAMLPKAGTKAEKADVYWRLAKISVILGEKETTKEGKQKVFGEGIKYAEQAIEADPKDPQGYMWHCANVGRECQTHNLMEQASAVDPMLKDLDMILNKLGCTNCSEAWQAKAEIYFHHPFKSNDEAVTFATNAVKTIPAGELRIHTYSLLAQILWERNYSAKKRNDTVSDRDEARSVLKTALKRYEQAAQHTSADARDYKSATDLLATMK